MGLDTMIYCNHSLHIPKSTEDIVDLMVQTWGSKSEIVRSLHVEVEDRTTDLNACKVLICSNGIDFEYQKFKVLRLNTDFMFSGFIMIYPRTIQFIPIMIGRNTTHMLSHFLDEPHGIYPNGIDEFHHAKKSWELFKQFLSYITSSIGGKIHLYINDGIFQSVQDIAWNGGTIEEMMKAANKITDPCSSKQKFIENHAYTDSHGFARVSGSVWFYEESN